MDLPLITEATADYYRHLYADPDLGPIFKGVNMVVLRTHVSYFLHQLSMLDTPLTQRQFEYLKKVHLPVIQEHNVNQRHYDILVAYLIEAMRASGAQDDHLKQVLTKLEPLRDLFPTHDSSSGDGTVVLKERHQEPKAVDCNQNSTGLVSEQPSTATVPGGYGCPFGQLQASGASNNRLQVQASSPQQDSKAKQRVSWVRRLTGCMRSS